MKRREFVRALSCAAATWPVAAFAQRPGKPPTIGFLGTATQSAQAQWVTAFEQRLRELGWIDGRTVWIEYRWAEGRSERYVEIAAEFAARNVDIIVTQGAAIAAAKRATSIIPIVFTVAADPVGSGAIASLSRPGGNVTGLSLQRTDIAGKRLELLREAVPGLNRLAIMVNPNNRASVLEMAEVRAAAGLLGLRASSFETQRAEDIATAFEAFKGGADALYVCSDPLAHTSRVRINTFALGMRLPTVYAFREFVEVGGLMSYGPSFADLFRRGADYVDKILRGAKPADLPVEQPTKFDLVVNLSTAKALGLNMPQPILLRATEVIE